MSDNKIYVGMTDEEYQKYRDFLNGKINLSEYLSKNFVKTSSTVNKDFQGNDVVQEIFKSKDNKISISVFAREKPLVDWWWRDNDDN